MSSVKLVSITASRLPELAGATPEEIIIYCGRVSSGRRDKREDYAGLVRYLINHGHWSPFEMASMCVEVVTSRAISAQMIRHRSFSFQEFSQRYASVQTAEPLNLRWQAETNRQSSTDAVAGKGAITLNAQANAAVAAAFRAYEALIEAGVARETARMVLPLATQTRLYMAGTIRSFIHYVDLRTKDDTQVEHREIAVAIRDIMKGEFPTLADALNW